MRKLFAINGIFADYLPLCDSGTSCYGQKQMKKILCSDFSAWVLLIVRLAALAVRMLGCPLRLLSMRSVLFCWIGTARVQRISGIHCALIVSDGLFSNIRREIKKSIHGVTNDKWCDVGQIIINQFAAHSECCDSLLFPSLVQILGQLYS